MIDLTDSVTYMSTLVPVLLSKTAPITAALAAIAIVIAMVWTNGFDTKSDGNNPGIYGGGFMIGIVVAAAVMWPVLSDAEQYVSGAGKTYIDRWWVIFSLHMGILLGTLCVAGIAGIVKDFPLFPFRWVGWALRSLGAVAIAAVCDSWAAGMLAFDHAPVISVVYFLAYFAVPIVIVIMVLLG